MKTKLSSKIAKIGESYTVYRYDNGFMFEANGRDADNDWVTTKILCSDVEGVIELVNEAAQMDLDS